MGIRFQCHHCGHQLHVKDFQAGKKGRCPVCQGAFRIPLSDAEYSVEPAADPSSPTKSISPIGQASAGQTSPGQSGFGGAGKRSSTAATAPARVPATKPDMAKVKTEAMPAIDRTSIQDNVEQRSSREQMPEASDIDQVQPRVISEAPDATWYVRPATGGQYGPAPSAIVWEWLIEDRIGHDSLVWREDWPEWLPARQVFSEFFSGGPNVTEAEQALEIAAIGNASSTSLSVPPTSGQSPTASPQAQQFSVGDPTASNRTPPASSREVRLRGRRRNYSIVIALLAVILISLIIGLFVVLYQQGMLGMWRLRLAI